MGIRILIIEDENEIADFPRLGKRIVRRGKDVEVVDL